MEGFGLVSNSVRSEHEEYSPVGCFERDKKEAEAEIQVRRTEFLA